MEGMRRGDIVAAVIAGDYGKPRPVLIVQDNAFRGLGSLTILPLTTALKASALIRLTIAPTQTNGLRTTSQIMIDKTATLALCRIGQTIGHADTETMQRVDVALAAFLGLGIA
jgi:mRNA interferase MazF